MTTDTDVASSTDTPAAAPAKVDAKPELKPTELKSKDTGVFSAIKAKADTATPQPKADKPEDKKPATDALPAVKGSDADSAAEHPDDDHKIEPWMRKRLARAEEKGRKQASAEILETIRSQRAAPAQQEHPPSQTGQPKQSEAPKTLADFEYDVEKFTQHQIREGVKTALAERDTENDKRKAEQKAQEARTAFEKRKAEFESRVGEGAWEEMVSARVDVPQEVIDLLTGHEKDLDIAHYLVNHPDELDSLRGKSKLGIARGLTAIETKLSGSREEELPPKTTKTPPPPPSISGAGKSTKSIADMSTAERIATWKAQKQSRSKSA